MAALFTCAVGGCSDDGDPDPDAGPDSGPEACEPTEEGACDEPVRCCPADRPYPGGPCEDDLFCQYPDYEGEFDATLDYACHGGRWNLSFSTDCNGGCTFDLAETCLEPFGGTLDGAVVQIGPASATDAFRPFEAGEDVTSAIEQGPQGCAMIGMRLQITGADPPDCVVAHTSTTVDGGAPMTSDVRVRMRCGESLGVLAILPGWDAFCESVGTHALAVEVSVEGVGTASAEASFEIRELDSDYCGCDPNPV